ncbi:hypothetical protein [Actinoalloteichus sp. GBA129-24]|uniref:aromatic-ring hydroxylase C-terminal domain-containing protein n=1 Tax=Actinoalloteichus sp. GBA129-24 TaxID=1612551 RepID=UPI00399C0CFD
MITGLDVRYPADDHPLAGRRVPNATLKTVRGATRVHELLHAARPVLLNLSGNTEVTTAGWTVRVDVVEARSEHDYWPVPVIGEVDAPAALLVRARD